VFREVGKEFSGSLVVEASEPCEIIVFDEALDEGVAFVV
jgi:hypothetical protein